MTDDGKNLTGGRDPVSDADVAYLPLMALRKMLDEGRIGSLELLELLSRRIARINPELNAIIQLDLDMATRVARDADQRTSPTRGRLLHGVPMTVKESFDVAGFATTRGIPEMADNRPSEDATTVGRLREAGAVIMGKTNVPYALADYQSYNAIWGVTNNPWNLERTPGGSSGGSAAALAAGLTPVELGGDLGGSIRIPAAFCGVFGHKPTYGVVPFGRNTFGNPEPAIDVAVAGPLARSAQDLSLLFELLSGPDSFQMKGWKLELPPPRAESLDSFRVAVWLDDSRFPVDAAVKTRLDRFAAELARRCARLRPAHPAIDVFDHFLLFVRLIRSATSRHVTDQAVAGLKSDIDRLSNRPDWQLEERKAVLISHRDWLNANAQRERYRHLWCRFFEDYDVLLCPVMPLTAFPHQLEPDFDKRRLSVNGQQRPYIERLFWSSLAGLSYLPSTVIPIGLASDGMPVGIQVIGAPYSDRSTLAFARLVEAEFGGFQRPPGY